MSPVMEIIAVISWLFVLKILQMGIWPPLKSCFGELAYGASYPVSLLLFTLLTWYCGLIHAPVQLAVLPFLVLAVYFIWKRQITADEFGANKKWDILFILCFLFLLEVRYINPTISFAEKFMDHAFLASIMSAPVVPPVDPWYAGGALNVYYYLGHWMMGVIGLTAGVASPLAFNLILPTVFANTAVGLYGLGHLLLKRFRWLPVLTLFIVNPSFIVLALAGKGISEIMWDATRTITDTINEFPLFSFLWGDPHAHVIALFNQTLFIFILVFAYLRWNSLSERGRWILGACAALSLGSMPGINSWDVLIYAPVILIAGAIVWWRSVHEEANDPYPWRLMLVVPPVSVLLYLPYYLMLETQGIGGLGLVTTPSDVGQYLLVFGFFLIVFLLACMDDIRRKPWLLLVPMAVALSGYTAAAIAVVPVVYFLARRERLPEELLAVGGLLIIILIEFVYLKDNMGDTYFRMNTVFKFSLVAWMMMSVSAFAFIGKWLSSCKYFDSLPARAPQIAVVFITFGLILVPFVIPDLNYGCGTKDLDGLAYLQNAHPDDAGGVDFLRSGSEKVCGIVEAEGGDYKYYSRVSSFTGLPTIIGMPFHEQMWRGDAANVSERMSDVRTIYENPEMTVQLMKKYGMTHLYVGESEREQYTVDIPVDALATVYDKDGVRIFRLSDAVSSGNQ